MPILAFGYHDRESPRHRSVCAALLPGGGRVIECHTDRSGFLPKCLDLIRKFRREQRGAAIVLVPFPGHFLMPLAWLLTRVPRKTLVFDALISLHDTSVDDRKLYGPLHPMAWALFAIDWASCRLADLVIVDTEAHRRFFIERFRLRPDRVSVVYLSARTDLFRPRAEPRLRDPRVFRVFFYGTYIPLQGIEHILDAAAIVGEKDPRVRFTLVGSGQTYPAMRGKAEALGLRNVEFRPPVSPRELPALIRGADLCLGVFGASPKTARVIPHKVYDAVACGVPVLTANTPAIRERFANHPGVLLCPAGNPMSIAEAILKRAKD